MIGSMVVTKQTTPELSKRSAQSDLFIRIVFLATLTRLVELANGGVSSASIGLLG